MALTARQQSAVNSIATAAVLSEKQKGIPAEFTVSQAIFESSYLTVMPAGSNNCFGIKEDGYGAGQMYAMTEEYLDGTWKNILQAFETYTSLADCFNDHARLITSGPYSVTWQWYEKDHDLDAYIRAVSLIYATDPNYGNEMVTEAHSQTVTMAVAKARVALL